jgi:hypothetical protein
VKWERCTQVERLRVAALVEQEARQFQQARDVLPSVVLERRRSLKLAPGLLQVALLPPHTCRTLGPSGRGQGTPLSGAGH